MELLLQRGASTKQSTIGKLFVDSVFECLTLEDVVREVRDQPVLSWKIPNETAIPSGIYQVVIDMSARFGRLMPHVLAVPGFEGIRIHPGNSAKDTEGCILLGLSQIMDTILDSRAAFGVFFPKLSAAIARQEKVMLTVENA